MWLYASIMWLCAGLWHEIRGGCSCFASAVWICGMRVYVVVQAFCTCGLVCWWLVLMCYIVYCSDVELEVLFFLKWFQCKAKCLCVHEQWTLEIIVFSRSPYCLFRGVCEESSLDPAWPPLHCEPGAVQSPQWHHHLFRRGEDHQGNAIVCTAGHQGFLEDL